jgi:hypothetical protein
MSIEGHELPFMSEILVLRKNLTLRFMAMNSFIKNLSGPTWDSLLDALHLVVDRRSDAIAK